jgi:glycosyltransferase involved in cell wall biosynthesis
VPRLSFCLVATFYPPHGFGGDAIHAVRLANGLAERGHRVRVVHSRTAYRMLARGEGPMDGFSHHPGIEIRECPSTRAAVTATYLTGKPLGYRGELERLLNDGFDVVQLSNPTLVGGPGGFELGSALKLYTAHEHWLMCPTHLLFRYKREVCTKRTCWRCTAVHGRPPQLWRSTRLLQDAMQHVDLLFCLSRFAAELHQHEFPHARIEVLPALGPDAAQLAEVPPPPERERPYFMFAGRLEPIKGVGRLIDAFANVRGADLLVAGDGSELGELRRSAEHVPAVRVMGRVSNDDVLSLCQGARALVFPSIGYEGFPLIVAEAMALGTPIVARDLGSMPEILDHGGGLLFADDHALVSALQRLVDEPATAARLGEEARTVFEQRYTEARFFRQYLDAIRRVAADTGRSDLALRAGEAADAESAYAGAP